MPPARQESVKILFLLGCPGFVEEKRACPDKQEEHQELVLKLGQMEE
jgi:hypothetical protein